VAWILLWQGFGLFGVIIAFLGIQSLVFIGAFLKISSQIGIILPNFIYIKEYLDYSIPLIPNSLIRWVTDSSDRYLVTYFLGLGSVGIYSASYSIGWLIQALVTPIQLILFPELSKLYDEGKENQVKIYLSYSLKYFLMLAIPAVFGLAALAQPILRILTTEEFVAGSTVIPIVALSGLMGGVFQIIINITHLAKQTKFNMYIHIFAAASNVLLNLFLIPYMGIEGAAVSTLISYSIMIAIATRFSRKYLWFKINYRGISKMIISAFLMYSCLLLIIPSNLLEILFSIIFGAALYFLLLIVTKTFSLKELSVIKR
jgi:O-antigen/teichoic acid export membrane protein